MIDWIGSISHPHMDVKSLLSPLLRILSDVKSLLSLGEKFRQGRNKSMIALFLNATSNNWLPLKMLP